MLADPGRLGVGVLVDDGELMPFAEVEEALAAASHQDDFTIIQHLLSVLAQPFDYSTPHLEEYSTPPAPGGSAYQTFCGT